jgi:hypothetical protein
VPARHRMGALYREHARALARSLGLYGEHWCDGLTLNNPELFLQTPQYAFRMVAWARVPATRPISCPWQAFPQTERTKSRNMIGIMIMTTVGTSLI